MGVPRHEERTSLPVGNLIVGSIDPFELFRIMSEIASARHDPATAATAEAVVFMIDQSHNVEGKIDAMIQLVVNI